MVMNTTKWMGILLMLMITVFFVGCSKNDDVKDSATLIKEYNLAGNYKVEITPKLMGTTAVTTGKHNAELTDEGNGVLRLRYSGFRAAPMPFEMSVDLKMSVKLISNDKLEIVNIGGDFDADLPKGTGVINPDDMPNGITLPDEALKNGLHSNGKSTISGKYHKISGSNNESMNFEWEVEPNIGLPIIISIVTISKIN